MQALNVFASGNLCNIKANGNTAIIYLLTHSLSYQWSSRV